MKFKNADRCKKNQCMGSSKGVVHAASKPENISGSACMVVAGTNLFLGAIKWLKIV